MRRLFRTFDPGTGVAGININWVRVLRVCLIPSSWWVIASRRLCRVSLLTKGLAEEVGRVNKREVGSSTKLIRVSLFLVLALSNFMGLCPFVFTRTRHIRFTFPLRIILWAGMIRYRFVKNFSLITKGKNSLYFFCKSISIFF